MARIAGEGSVEPALGGGGPSLMDMAAFAGAMPKAEIQATDFLKVAGSCLRSFARSCCHLLHHHTAPPG